MAQHNTCRNIALNAKYTNNDPANDNQRTKVVEERIKKRIEKRVVDCVWALQNPFSDALCKEFLVLKLPTQLSAIL